MAILANSKQKNISTSSWHAVCRTLDEDLIKWFHDRIVLISNREYQLIQAKHLVEFVAEGQLDIVETPQHTTKGGATARGHQVDTEKALVALIEDYLVKTKATQQAEGVAGSALK